ncbi:MAG: hypothetical protein KF761_05500 [Salinibacterium sp.]|nr:hypothetical protein [Salinibacterium sp.]
MSEVVKRVDRHPFVTTVAVLLFAECALLTAATVYLIVELIVATPLSFASAIALLILTAIAAVWLGFIAVNVLRGRAWTRGAAIVWQVLQGAVAIGCFQGVLAQPEIGWWLLIPALVVMVLLFTPPVVAAISRRDG